MKMDEYAMILGSFPNERITKKVIDGVYMQSPSENFKYTDWVRINWDKIDLSLRSDALDYFTDTEFYNNIDYYLFASDKYHEIDQVINYFMER